MITVYTATHESDDMTIHFKAMAVDSYRDEAPELQDVTVYCMDMLGVDIEFDSLPIALQGAILELSNEVEFVPE
ncbi:MAG: hypothetical protein ACSHXL_00055 [Bacteroidota bacterium]